LTVGLGLAVLLAGSLLGVRQLVRHVDDTSHGAQDLIEPAQVVLHRAEVHRLCPPNGFAGDGCGSELAREGVVTMDHPDRAIGVVVVLAQHRGAALLIATVVVQLWQSVG
jgi:hypothetical protein